MSSSDIETIVEELKQLKIIVSDLEQQITKLNASSSVTSTNICIGSKVRILNPSREIEHTSSATVYKISKVFPHFHHVIFPDNTKSRRIAKNLRLS